MNATILDDGKEMPDPRDGKITLSYESPVHYRDIKWLGL